MLGADTNQRLQERSAPKTPRVSLNKTVVNVRRQCIWSSVVGLARSVGCLFAQSVCVYESSH